MGDEAHLAVLRDRVERRQLAGGEDVVGEPVARRGAEVLVLQLVVDGARHALEVGGGVDRKAAEQQRAVLGQLPLDPVRPRRATTRTGGRCSSSPAGAMHNGNPDAFSVSMR